MAMFIMSACNNEEGVNIDGNENFPEMSEELKDNSAVIKNLSTHIKEDTELPHQEREGYRSYYECFHSLETLKDSPYASLIEELPNVDWEKQTLVIAYIYDNYIFDREGCNVYCKSDKYTIEYKVCPLIGAAIDSQGVAIVLNKPHVKKKDVNFKVSIAGLDYEN